MSEIAPNISSPSVGSGTSGGVSSISSPAISYESGGEGITQAPALQGEVLSPSSVEIEKGEGFNESDSIGKYQDGQTVADGLLDDAKQYGFKGSLERLAAGKTGETEEDLDKKDDEKRKEQLKNDKKDDEKKDKKQSGKDVKKKEDDETEKEDPHEKILQEIEKLLELIRELQRQNKKLIEKQKKLEAELKESQNQLSENGRDHQKELLGAISKQKRETDANITVLFERLEAAQVQSAA